MQRIPLNEGWFDDAPEQIKKLLKKNKGNKGKGGLVQVFHFPNTGLMNQHLGWYGEPPKGDKDSSTGSSTTESSSTGDFSVESSLGLGGEGTSGSSSDGGSSSGGDGAFGGAAGGGDGGAAAGGGGMGEALEPTSKKEEEKNYCSKCGRPLILKNKEKVCPYCDTKKDVQQDTVNDSKDVIIEEAEDSIISYYGKSDYEEIIGETDSKNLTIDFIKKWQRRHPDDRVRLIKYDSLMDEETVLDLLNIYGEEED